MAEACQVDLTCDNSSLALTFLLIVATINVGAVVSRWMPSSSKRVVGYAE